MSSQDATIALRDKNWSSGTAHGTTPAVYRGLGSGEVPGRLRTNVFPLTPKFDKLHTYEVSFSPEPKPSASADKGKGKGKDDTPVDDAVQAARCGLLLHALRQEKTAGSLTNLKPFYLQPPKAGAKVCLLYSPTKVDNFTAKAKDSTISFTHKAELSADAEEARGPVHDVIVQAFHAARKQGMRYTQVGRRHLYEVVGDKTPMCLAGYQVHLAPYKGTVANPDGKLFSVMSAATIENTRLPVMTKDCMSLVIEVAEGCSKKVDDAHLRATWMSMLEGKTVVTLYNNRPYRVKKVRFDLCPQDSFKYYERSTRKADDTTFQQYIEVFYGKKLKHLSSGKYTQPMLEVHPTQKQEQVLLIPEMCALGCVFPDGVPNQAPNFNIGQVLDEQNISPGHRLEANDVSMHDLGNKLEKTVEIGRPVEVNCRTLPSVEICFGQKKHAAKNGDFAKYLRNGLQIQGHFTDWIFIHPPSEAQIVEIWLRSLRDIAQVAFQISFSNPTRVSIDNHAEKLEEVIREKVKPTTEMIMVLTPEADSKRTYQTLKRITCTQYPCVSQVVKSETIRKRTSIAQLLMRIILQMNAKLCGASWHAEVDWSRAKDNGPSHMNILSTPTMVVGVDIFYDSQAMWVGFAASINPQSSEYFQRAINLTTSSKSHMEVFKSLMEEGFKRFADRNGSVLPTHVVVYRGSMNVGQVDKMNKLEVGAILEAAANIGCSNVPTDASSTGTKTAYEPTVTMIGVAKTTSLRVYSTGKANLSLKPVEFDKNDLKEIKSPDSGTLIDSMVTYGDVFNFYLVNQYVMNDRGVARPSHYIVTYDSANFAHSSIQYLTYVLTFLYYNHPGSVRFPAPLMYARKVAQFTAQVVKTPVSERLTESFYYL
jgi:hypothetical protein